MRNRRRHSEDRGRGMQGPPHHGEPMHGQPPPPPPPRRFGLRRRPRKHGCYIATNVYGTYDCPEVWTLRRYRDDYLAHSLWGRTFVRIYYTASPILVNVFGQSKTIRKLWKKYLDRKVERLQEQGFDNHPYQDKDW